MSFREYFLCKKASLWVAYILLPPPAPCLSWRKGGEVEPHSSPLVPVLPEVEAMFLSGSTLKASSPCFLLPAGLSLLLTQLRFPPRLFPLGDTWLSIPLAVKALTHNPLRLHPMLVYHAGRAQRLL